MTAQLLGESADEPVDWLPGESRALAGPSLDVVRRCAAGVLDRMSPAPLAATLRVAGYEQICGRLAEGERRLSAALAVTRAPGERAELA
ncbi:MAG: hypothetical protein KIT69_19125, partial [Propionibacteriaceae bacterium]|nr:hypothetical protein [Propionibacteriaceae bacterium]